MPASRFRLKYPKMMVPSLAVVLAYVIFGAIPQRSQGRQIADGLERRTIALDTLRRRAQVQPHDSDIVRMVRGQSDKNVSNPIADSQTAVQSLKKVVHMFQSHGVQCTNIEPGNLDPTHPRSSSMRHRLSLVGSFHDVLAAFASIEANIPHASALILSMNRPEPAEPCQWESEFRFMEALQ